MLTPPRMSKWMLVSSLLSVLAGCATIDTSDRAQQLGRSRLTATALADGAYATVTARMVDGKAIRLEPGDKLLARVGEQVVPMREAASSDPATNDYVYVADVPVTRAREKVTVEFVAADNDFIASVSGTIPPHFDAQLTEGFTDLGGVQYVVRGESLVMKVSTEPGEPALTDCDPMTPRCEALEVRVRGECVVDDVAYANPWKEGMTGLVNVAVRAREGTESGCPIVIEPSRYASALSDGPHTLSGRRSGRFTLRTAPAR